MKAHGLPAGSVAISEKVMAEIIEGYTREAGVRTLERTLARVVRKAAVEMLSTDAKRVSVTPTKMKDYLGSVQYLRDPIEKKSLVGVVNGLAVTSVGGETLAVECAIMQGAGSLQLTGKLGDVMQESARAALSWVREHSDAWGIPAEYYKQHDIHIHVPEGAVPKDGPSAGVAITTALVSALTGIPVRQDVAMTGEITLRGRVLPIGGLKEKLLAAYRAGLSLVLYPKENTKDLEEVPANVLTKLEVIPVEQTDEVLTRALTAPLPAGSMIFPAVTAPAPTACQGA